MSFISECDVSVAWGGLTSILPENENENENVNGYDYGTIQNHLISWRAWNVGQTVILKINCINISKKHFRWERVQSDNIQHMFEELKSQNTVWFLLITFPSILLFSMCYETILSYEMAKVSKRASNICWANLLQQFDWGILHEIDVIWLDLIWSGCCYGFVNIEIENIYRLWYERFRIYCANVEFIHLSNTKYPLALRSGCHVYALLQICFPLEHALWMNTV